MDSSKDQALKIWKETGEVTNIEIFDELRKIIGEKDYSDFDKEYWSFADVDPDGVWLFTNIDQVSRCNTLFFTTEEKEICLRRFLGGEKTAWFITGWPWEH